MPYCVGWVEILLPDTWKALSAGAPAALGETFSPVLLRDATVYPSHEKRNVLLKK
jgi:hypothetical protein